MTTENNNEESKLEKSVKLATEISKAVPIYQDAVQPSAQEIGKSLAVVTKTVNVALAPIKALVWGYEQIEEFIITRVSEKLKNTPEENITTPPPEVAGPAVEALRFAGHNENLRELYANLLATSMDKVTSYKAHPGFVELLKNLSSDEAILLQAFISQKMYPLIDIRGKSKDSKLGYAILRSNYSHLHKKVNLASSDLLPTYLDNLCRLGILEIPPLVNMTAPDTYEPLENDSELDQVRHLITNVMDRTVEYGRKTIGLTAYGSQFVDSVVKEK